jgi:hypothetical protein
MLRFALLGSLLALTACAAPTAPRPDDSTVGGWFGKADAAIDEHRRAWLVVPIYTHSVGQRTDTAWVLENAGRIRDDLDYRGWDVDLFTVASLDDFAAILDEEIAAGTRIEALVLLGHANQRGMFFDHATGQNDREWLQAGWDWEGPGRVLDRSAGSGVASLEGLMELTDRLGEVVRPGGIIVLGGCRTARSRQASRADVANGIPGAVPPTPFVDPDDGTPFDSYTHAVAALTGRTTYGSRIRDNVGQAPEKVWTIFFGGPDGTGDVPRWWVRAVPDGGAAKADGTVVEGGLASGPGCVTYQECLFADEAWDVGEGG